MAHVERGDARLGDEPADEVGDARLGRDIEAGGGLVQDEDLGAAGERERDRDALLLAAAEFVRVAAQGALRLGKPT